jgi:hypothetical protein
MDPTKPNKDGNVLPETLIVDEVLNNVDYQIVGFKNYNPIMIHG